MPNLFDNLSDDTRLKDALRVSLKDFDTVDVATGYLDLRGWSSMADIVATKPRIGAEPVARVLIGMVAPADSLKSSTLCNARFSHRAMAPIFTTEKRHLPVAISS